MKELVESAVGLGFVTGVVWGSVPAGVAIGLTVIAAGIALWRIRRYYR